MAAKCASGVRPNENVKLRQTITDMVTNIESVMSNIHVVLGDMGVLVQQIDSITSRLEDKYEKKSAKTNILLDANRNQYEVVETPGVVSNHSKLPSPFIDYTYLDLAENCNMCGHNVQNTSITYNKKYPLWIQCDNWQTGNTGNSPSDLSLVSAGSDDSDMMHSGSDGCSQSWKSISNFGPCPKDSSFKRKTSSDFKARLLTRYSECCNSGGTPTGDTYCGVYEEIMEAQLDDINPVLHDESLGFDIHDSFSDSVSTDGSVCSATSFSMSDEHIVHFSKVSNTWTAFKLMDVTVREFSDSNTSL